MVKALDKFFFAPVNYNPLGFLRIALSFWILKEFLSPFSQFPREALLYDGAYVAPFFVRLLGLPFPVSGEQLYLLHVALAVATALALCGFLTRISVFVTGFLLMYVESVNNASNIYNHEASLVCLLLMFMAFAPGVQSMSLDNALIWGWKYIRKQKEAFGPAFFGRSVSGWGVQFILVMLAILYLSAGASKVRFTGWRWLDGRTLEYYLSGKPSAYRTTDIQRFIGEDAIPEERKWRDGFGIYAHHYGYYRVSHPDRKLKFLNTIETTLSEFVMNTPGIIAFLSIATVILEMSGPILLLGGWYRTIFFILAIGMHQTIGVLMGLPFLPYKIICFLMIDWDHLYRSLAYRLPVVRRLAKVQE